MKKTRGLILIMLTIVAILVGGMPVKAADYTVAGNLSTVGGNVLVPGETVTIAFNISSIDMGDNPGINAMQATIDYDKKVFSPITVDDIEGKNGWSAGYSNKLVLSRLSGCTKSTNAMCNITFKVLSNIENGTETTISLKDITVAGTKEDWSSGDITVNPVSVTLRTGSAHDVDVPNEDPVNPTNPTDPTNPTNPTDPTTPNSGDNNGSGSGSNSGSGSGNNSGNGSGSSLGTSADGKNGSTTSKDSKNGSTDKTTSSKKIPAAGLNMYVVSAIVVVAIAGTIGFVLYARLKKEIK